MGPSSGQMHDVYFTYWKCTPRSFTAFLRSELSFKYVQLCLFSFTVGNDMLVKNNLTIQNKLSLYQRFSHCIQMC